MIDLSQAVTSEPDFEKKQIFEPLKFCPPILQQRSAKGKHLEGYDTASLILGIVIIAGGILLLLDSYELIDMGGNQYSPAIAIYMNILGGSLGGGFIFWGWAEIRNRKKLEINRTLKPESPWYWDFDWKIEGIRDDLAEQLFWRAWMVVFGLGLFGPVSWMVFFSDHVEWQGFYWLVASIFIFVDLIFAAAVSLLVYQNLKFFKYGIPKIKFLEFPFFSENKIRAQLDNLPKTFSRMTLELRFIQEEHEAHGESYIYKFFQLFKEAKVFMEVPRQWDGRLLIDWQLPDKPEYVTCLNAHPSRYWELEVKVETSGVDYHSRFVLPVYAKP